jgi:hypothetical protein
VNLQSVEAVIYSSSVTISDPKAPTIGALSGTLTAGGWLRGVQTAAVSGADETGVKDLQLVRDGGVVAAADVRTCDYSKTAPCDSPGQNVASNWAGINTATWPDGNHQVKAVVHDAADNAKDSATILVRTDNTAPAAPIDLTVVGGSDWSAEGTRSLFWTLPDGQASPIVGARVQICHPNLGCQEVAADDPSTTQVLLPGEGTLTGKVYLEDQAGNVNPANGAPFTILYDATPPPAPTLGDITQNGTANSFAVDITPNDPGPAPLNRLTGEICDEAEASCIPIPPQDDTTHINFVTPGPGTWKLKVRVTDAAGNVGATATSPPFTYAEPTTPTPTPTGTATATATVTSTAQPTATATSTATPTTTATATATPTATPTTTPPPRRRRIGIEIDSARLTRRKVVVRGQLTKPATGTIKIKVRARRHGKLRAKKVTQPVQARGHFKIRITLPERLRGIRFGRLIVTYGGDETYRPARVKDVVGR